MLKQIHWQQTHNEIINNAQIIFIKFTDIIYNLYVV